MQPLDESDKLRLVVAGPALNGRNKVDGVVNEDSKKGFTPPKISKSLQYGQPGKMKKPRPKPKRYEPRHEPWSKSQMLKKKKQLKESSKLSSSSTSSTSPNLPLTSATGNELNKNDNSPTPTTSFDIPLVNVRQAKRGRRRQKKKNLDRQKKESLRLLVQRRQRRLEISGEMQIINKPRSVEVTTGPDWKDEEGRNGNDLNKMLFMFAVDLVPVNTANFWKSESSESSETSSAAEARPQKGSQKKKKGSLTKLDETEMAAIQTHTQSLSDKYKVLQQGIEHMSSKVLSNRKKKATRKKKKCVGIQEREL